MENQNYIKMFGMLFVGCIVLSSVAAPVDSLNGVLGGVKGSRERLSAQLDSLELLKQQLKRQGLPLENLEKQAILIKDSLDDLRRRVSIKDAPVQPGTKEGLFSKEWFLSSARGVKVLDWVIALVASIAAVSGIILVQGILHSLKNRKKSRKLASPGADTPKGVGGATNSALLRGDVGDMSALASLRALNAAGRSEQVTVEVERITRSMQIQNDDPAPEPEPDPAAYRQTQIITAIKDGQSYSEIARTYKMSIDQIHLIARLTSKK